LSTCRRPIAIRPSSLTRTHSRSHDHPVGTWLSPSARTTCAAPLVRTEAAVFLEQWLEQVESFTCPPDPLDWAKGRLSNIVLDALPVRVEPVT
jgi:hypothetical protein